MKKRLLGKRVGGRGARGVNVHGAGVVVIVMGDGGLGEGKEGVGMFGDDVYGCIYRPRA